MSKIKIACLVVCVLALSFFANMAFAAKKVIVVAGVSEANGKEASYFLITGGINDSLKEAGIVPEYMWVDLDAVTDPAEKEKLSLTTVEKIKAATPDLVIVLNDNCLKNIGTKIDTIPVVFSYVFGNPASLGLPKSNITGVTRVSYAADIWALANKLFGAKTVALISKSSPSMEGVRKYLFAGADKLKAASGVQYKEMYLLNTFEEWEKTVKEFPEDFIYLADTSRITQGDKILPRTEVTAWTVANSKVPVVGATETDVEAGALYAIVTSENALGVNAAEVAKKILNGTAPADIPYVPSKKGKLVINAKTAQKYKLEIPYDILSSAEKVYE
ncbi:MAG: hypothetical protein KKE62_13480 [Proteobacteria bacterium]|nr:hypothetical protein [Pseudomonadota bacterium]MBU1389833.1 hypothetical protein [Pseudomonadota bacterium]MBU1543842.1 hypothetical protein [Pseudomonadota bacterium]MBU2481125.1 hypothetical protein [Pseudomonadota bacterium]